MTALDHKLIRDLLHRRGQVLALTLVVACGVAAYVTMRAAYHSLEDAQRDYYSRYRFADVFSHVKRAPRSVLSAISAIPGVNAAEARIVMEVTLDVPGLLEPATARLLSLPKRGSPRLNELFLSEGRKPQAANEVLLSEPFAAANRLKPGSQVSAILNGKWAKLTVVGRAISPEFVYEIRPAEVFTDNRRFGILWMSEEAAAAAFNMEGAFNDVTIALERHAVEQDVIARLDLLLERYGSLGAYGRREHTSARILADHIEEMRVLGMILPTIFLSIVAFLLHILMSRLIGTQRGQIGVLKSFGYSNWEIGLHYLKLALLSVSAGTILGNLLGLWFGSGLTALFAEYFRFPVLNLSADYRVLLFASGISAIAACTGALAAVRSAVSWTPAEAMLPEAPAHFRPGWMEHSGLRVLFSPPLRMTMRNLERRPFRAFLSTLAISFSIAILIVGLFQIDAVHELAAIQFNQIQREDVAVVFREARSPAALPELAQLPGVLRVEPFRQIPVRLRFEHRTRLVSLTGLSHGATLRRPLDARMRVLDLPEEGLLLNTKLAELLGVSAGEFLTVEVLEGERRRRDVMVTRLVDEPVGLGAYMSNPALSRLLREGPAVSGAYLQVDPLAIDRLYSLLKRMPVIAGVTVRETAMASFWKMVGDSITSTTSVLVACAVVIAFGIVYNSARISLSERANELASLRVLGFTSLEITRILLGEQAILTLAAIPIGFLTGNLLARYVTSLESQEILRLPFVISNRTYLLSSLTIVVAALFSGLVVAWRLRQMDLTTALKSRE